MCLSHHWRVTYSPQAALALRSAPVCTWSSACCVGFTVWGEWRSHTCVLCRHCRHRRPLGFSLDDKAVKRAGLDYWPRVDVSVHEAWQDFEDNVLQHVDRVVFYSKQSKHGTVNALDADLT